MDEFALKVLQEYDGKAFKSTAEDDLGIEMSDDEKQAIEEKANASKDLMTAIKEALGDKVADVRLSARLKSHPVTLAESRLPAAAGFVPDPSFPRACAF